MGSCVTYPSPLLLAALLLSAGLPVWGQDPALQSADRRVPQVEQQSYVAIMGQVARPGAYEIRLPHIDLAEFIGLAGGLSDRASGSLRIIRRGSGGQQVFFNQQIRFTLAHGDLVVAEPRRFANYRSSPGSSMHRVVGIDESQSPAVAAAPDTVEVGLVQLIDRPVVLDVPAGRDTLAGVLGMLRQRAVGNSSITLLRPNGRREEIPLSEAAATTLSSGTIVVFDPKTVDVQALPRLPAVIRPTAVATATTLPETEGEDSIKSAAVDAITNASTGDASISNNADPGLLSSVAAGGKASALVPRSEAPIQAPTQAPSTTRTALAADLTVDDLPQPTPVSESGTRSRIPAASLRPMTPHGTAPASPIAGMAVPLIVVGGVFVMVLAVLQSMTRQSTRTDSAVATITPRRVWSLNDLIENRIPVVEEALPFPAEFRIHGPPPLRERHLRADVAHPAPRPHFLDAARKPARPKASGARAVRDPVIPDAVAIGATESKKAADIAAAIERARARPASPAPPPVQELNPAPHGPHRVDRAFYRLHGGRL